MIDKFSQYTIIFVFIIVLFLGMLGTIFKEKQYVSELENRNLAQLPYISLQNILDGTFANSMESYVGDHLFLRNIMIEKFTDLQLHLGRKEVNDITIINNSMLLSKLPDHPTNNRITTAINKLENFSTNSRSNVYLYFVPFKTVVMKDYYTYYYNYKFKKKLGKDIFFEIFNDMETNFHAFDIYTLWEKRYSFEQILSFYFITDHHWNHEGSFLAYVDIITDLQNVVDIDLGDPYTKEDLILECFDNVEFLGSYHKKLYYLGDFTEDEVCRYVVEEFPNFVRYDNNGNETDLTYRETFFSEINDNTKFVDYWSLYSPTLGLLKFENDDSLNDLNALIIRDSYSNPILPLMAKHFKSLYVIDPRHLKLDSIEDFIEEHSIDITLLLYNDRNFESAFYSLFDDN